MHPHAQVEAEINNAVLRETPSFPFKFLVRPSFSYFAHRVRGNTLFKTAVEYPGPQQAEEARRATLDLNLDGRYYLLYDGLFIRFSEWLAACSTPAHMLSVFQQITQEIIKQQPRGFVDIQQSFGIDVDRIVKFLKSPNGSVEDSLSSLNAIATRIVTRLLILCQSASAEYSLISGFVSFFRTCEQLKAKGLINKLPAHLANYHHHLILHHPATLSRTLLVRMFYNLGKVRRVLERSKQFRTQIQNAFINWRAPLMNTTNQHLYAVYHHLPGGYGFGEVLLFCLNCIKHYGDKAEQLFPKEDIVDELCGVIPRLAVKAFDTFGECVLEHHAEMDKVVRGSTMALVGLFSHDY